MTLKGRRRYHKATDRNEWLRLAMRRYGQLGGIETPENRIAVTLFLYDRFEMGCSVEVAARRAVARYHDGEFERRNHG